MKPFKIGLAGSSQLSFPGDKKAAYHASAEALRALAAKLKFELYVYEPAVITAEDAYAAVRALEDERVDMALLQCTSFSAGALAPVFARIKNAVLGLWALPEHAEQGVVPFNSFCSINMYAGIIGHYLNGYNIPLKWFYGDVSDPLFGERLGITVRALRAIKNLRASSVALIGGIAPGFDDLYDDERKLIQRFDGLRVNRLHEYSEVRDRAVKYSAAEVAARMAEIAADAKDTFAKAVPVLETNARFSMAYDDFIREHGYDAIAVSCWPKFQDEFQYSVCSVVGGLNDKGTPTACEGDLTSAVSMLLLKYIADDETMLMDLSAFDRADDTLLLWHCGPAGKRFCADGGYSLGVNYHGMAHEEGFKEPNCCGVTRDMVFDAGEVTVARIAGECDTILTAGGAFLGDVKPSFHGSRGWLGGLKLDRAPISALDFVNTLLVRRFSHHFPIVRGDFSAEVLEAAAWLGMGRVKPVPYEAYMQNPNW